MSNDTDRHMRFFERIAMDAANEIHSHLESLVGSEYAHATAAANAINGDNCAWQLYHLKPLVQECLLDQERFNKGPGGRRDTRG